ncbi:hypothetical protein Ssi03_12310 [Sphaerisporangium siamense]|nr:hypothetical protein Ssi03_12310 [Sphaerisporangium siamense]
MTEVGGQAAAIRPCPPCEGRVPAHAAPNGPDVASTTARKAADTPRNAHHHGLDIPTRSATSAPLATIRDRPRRPREAP